MHAGSFLAQRGDAFSHREGDLDFSIFRCWQTCPSLGIKRTSEANTDRMGMRKAVLPWPSLESPLNKYWNDRHGRFLKEHPYAGKKGHQASIPATPSFREPDQDVALAQRCGAQRKATANAK